MEEKYVCYDCVEEEYLKAEIKKNFLVNCSYCGSEENEGYPLTELAHCVGVAFQQHFIKSPDSPPDNWNSYHYNILNWEPPGNLVLYAIADAAGVSEEIAGDIQQFLYDDLYDHEAAKDGQMGEFHDESYYDVKDADDEFWQKRWSKFEFNLKTSARYYSAESEELLTSIFTGIESLDTHDKRPVIRYIGPDSDIKYLYRARAFQSDEKLKLALQFPEKELGPPPTEYATAGRMNARGISVFYGATDEKTALAEIRPPVGSRVTVSRFDLTRQLKVMDLSALTYSIATGSIFDENYAEALSKSMFLQKLSQKMTKPVMPDDEHFEYLITQVISEFLFSSLEFDGIIFPSAQSKVGLNVTLFHHASRVSTIGYPEGTKAEVRFSEWDGENDVVDYKVIRRLPKVKKRKVSPKDLFRDLPGLEWTNKDIDGRVESLALNLSSIKVEHIESVEIKSTGYLVEQMTYRKISDTASDDILDI